jgi:hypothetical protein
MALPERVARLEVRVEDLEGETQRSRQRLHSLEADRATIRLLASQVKAVLESTERVATSAAEKAVDLALKIKHRERREDWAYRLTWISVGSAMAGAFAAVVVLFL